MPPQLALALGYAFIFWIFQKDRLYRKAPSAALLVPGLWVAISTSRPVGYWLGDEKGDGGEGSIVNIVVQGLLILLALIILARRRFSWSLFVQLNIAAVLIYLYYLASSAWSPMPISTVKRIVKDFGCVIIALVMLTEERPFDAMRMIFVRCSYIMFPLSVVFIKYFPKIGRSASKAGESMFTGVAMQKNSLGQIVVVFTLFLLWDLLEMRKQEGQVPPQVLKTARQIRYILLAMGLWLAITCDSQTSILCALLGIAIVFATRRLLRFANPRAVFYRILVALCLLFVAEKTFHISETIVTMMGRNMTFTGRTEIWDNVKAQKTNPLIGCGYYTFWETRLAQNVFQEINAEINTAHNGYLEAYLDGGWIALILLSLLLLQTGWRAMNRMLTGTWFGAFSLAFWAINVVYNNSESSFFRLESLWLILFLMTIKMPQYSAVEMGQINTLEDDPLHPSKSSPFPEAA